MHVVRKIVSFLLTGAIACALLASCGGSSTSISSATPPTVDFTYVATGLSVAFNGTATSAISGVTPAYSWNFGDGSTATTAVTTAQATHVYTAPGIYTVTLTAVAGNSASRTEQVTVTGGTPTAFDVENWAWVSGSRYANSFGTYQTEYTPSPLNQPGARQNALTWTDKQGRLWLFGGSGYDSNGSSGPLNDVWRFDPSPNSASDTSGGQWTWVSGSNKVDALGVYGTQGQASVGAVIGARAAAAGWVDANGNFWVFGGTGIDSIGAQGYLGDMWMISPVTGTPTWYGGANLVNSAGSATMPGARAYATTWTDHNGFLWMFGGQSINSSGTAVTYNDLWKFNPTSFQWTLVAGSATPTNAGGSYGIQGTASATNLPGARLGAVGWTDKTGILWMFGGSGYDSVGTGGMLNDMWAFNPTTGQWTWVNGAETAGAAGNYSVVGTAAASNLPSSRVGGVAWTDTTGRLWLFGGGGFDSTGVSTTSDGGGDLNDLWSFNTTTREWTWMGGPSVAGGAGVFATPASNSPLNYNTLNTPGARAWANGWVDANGNFWLFGGSGVDAELVNGELNDLWTIQLIVPAP